MFTIYRPSVELDKKVSKNINIAGDFELFLNSDCPYTRLVALKATTPFLKKSSPNAKLITKATREAVEAGLLQPVATVDTYDAEEAYKLTNSIDSHWSENEAVTMHIKEGMSLYSTSVGDILLDWVKCTVVASIGFFELKLTEGVKTNPIDWFLEQNGFTEMYGIRLWAKEEGGFVVDTNSGMATLYKEIDGARIETVVTIDELAALFEREGV